MTSPFLPIHVENALEELEERVPLLEAGRLDLDGVLDLCRWYRVAGIGGLFLEGEPAELQRRLAQSGRAFAHWSERAGEEEKVASLALPFFDAVAAGDLEGAAAIARTSRRSHARGQEYEEDFLFVEWVMQRFVLGADAAGLERLLARWEEALDGAADPRLDLARAAAAGKGRAAGLAFRAFLDDRQRTLEARADLLEPEVADTEGSLSVEGVALARLADAAGLRIGAEFPNVPALARKVRPLQVPADVWRMIR